ncbi:MAG: histidine phosphatase family protein [Sphingomicrobium sp.]
MKLLATLVAAAAALSAIAAPATAAGPVYVIRHLQKEAGRDPALTAQGSAGAQRLSHMLAGNGIKAVFATATRRAQQTGAPLAARLRLPVTTYDPDDTEALVKAVVAAGGPVLVVGHSNTVPDLVAAFGGDEPAAIADDEYETIYVVDPCTSEVRLLLLTRQ